MGTRSSRHPHEHGVFVASGPRSRRVAADKSSQHLAARAVELYQPLTSRKLTEEDGREIVRNLAGFLSVLAEWKKRERAARGGAR